jgi:hypothetical protein
MISFRLPSRYFCLVLYHKPANVLCKLFSLVLEHHLAPTLSRIAGDIGDIEPRGLGLDLASVNSGLI